MKLVTGCIYFTSSFKVVFYTRSSSMYFSFTQGLQAAPPDPQDPLPVRYQSHPMRTGGTKSLSLLYSVYSSNGVRLQDDSSSVASCPGMQIVFMMLTQVARAAGKHLQVNAGLNGI